MAERLTKHLAVASFGCVGCAAFPMTGKDAKRLAVPGTLSRSLAIGRTIREARKTGGDPLDAVSRGIEDVWVLYRGVIAKRHWESREGYMWGEHELEGTGPDAGVCIKPIPAKFRADNEIVVRRVI